MTLLEGELVNSMGFGYRTTNDSAEATMDAQAEVGQTYCVSIVVYIIFDGLTVSHPTPPPCLPESHWIAPGTN